MGKSEGRRRGRPTSLARQLADEFMESRPAEPGRLALDADVACLTDDPAKLKLLICELQFENDLLRGIIDRGGGTSLILDGY